MKQLFKPTNFDFMQHRKAAMIFSAVLILISLGSVLVQGLKLGIDFTGGTLLEVGYQEAVELPQVRSTLDQAGFGDATVQLFGTPKDVLVRIAPKEGERSALSDRAFNALNDASGGHAKLRRVEFVGPQVG
ncbi:MAG: protein translocase subunit SecF, partial [bacterium]|nr:protein translocase subunit SecF [bacterium]